MTLPIPAPPRIPGGLLDTLLATFDDRGWDPAMLATVRMDAGDDGGDDDGGDELDDLSDEDAEALRGLSAEDRKKLEGLSDEQRAALKPPAEDPRIKQARDEAVRRRRELKPWKDLGKELGMTPDEVRAAVKAAKKGGGKPDPDDKGGKGDDPDPDEIRREAQRDADAKANRRIVKAEIRVLARDMFADPDDAPRYLDLDEYDVDDDGDLVDPDQVTEDLKKILTSKPHLAKKQKGKPKPNEGQGRRGSPLSGADAGKAEAERRYGKAKAAAGSS